jgi:hypothetical protein
MGADFRVGHNLFSTRPADWQIRALMLKAVVVPKFAHRARDTRTMQVRRRVPWLAPCPCSPSCGFCLLAIPRQRTRFRDHAVCDCELHVDAVKRSIVAAFIEPAATQ